MILSYDHIYDCFTGQVSPPGNRNRRTETPNDPKPKTQHKGGTTTCRTNPRPEHKPRTHKHPPNTPEQPKPETRVVSPSGRPEVDTIHTALPKPTPNRTQPDPSYRTYHRLLRVDGLRPHPLSAKAARLSPADLSRLENVTCGADIQTHEV